MDNRRVRVIVSFGQMSGMHYDYSKRNYLLPHGCKDLIDFLKFQEKDACLLPPDFADELPLEFQAFWKLPKAVVPGQDVGNAKPTEVVISDKISIQELSLIVGVSPVKIVAELLHLGDLVSMKEDVAFETAARLLKKHGFIAKRPG